jgi:hypothetical protein
LKIQGRGYLKFLPKSLGGQYFQEKLPGSPHILGFIAFLLTSVLKFAWERPIFTSPPSPLSPYVHLCQQITLPSSPEQDNRSGGGGRGDDVGIPRQIFPKKLVNENAVKPKIVNPFEILSKKHILAGKMNFKYYIPLLNFLQQICCKYDSIFLNNIDSLSQKIVRIKTVMS